MLTISGGDLRGRRIRPPDSPRIRPTTGQVREALFSMLADEVAGSLWIDLFSGSGIMAMEAVSRGAERALCVEQWSVACRAIKQSLTALKRLDQIHLIRGRVESAGTLKRLDAPVEEWLDRYDTVGSESGGIIIFMDPPYARDLVMVALNALKQRQWFQSLSQLGALNIVAEHESTLNLADKVVDWPVERRRQYGETALSFFRPAL